MPVSLESSLSVFYPLAASNATWNLYLALYWRRFFDILFFLHGHVIGLILSPYPVVQFWGQLYYILLARGSQAS